MNLRRHLLILLLLVSAVLRAQDVTSDLSPRPGYKYFVSLSLGCHMGHSMLSGRYGSTAFPSTTVTTTHGWQLSRQLFLGGGTGVTAGFAAGHSRGIASIPVFAAVRYSPMEGRYSMALGLRVGYSIGFGRELNPDGFYLSPSAGIRIGLKPSLALNLTLSYVLQRQGVDTIYDYYRSTRYEYIPLHGIMASAHLEF